jgi:signal transduction histidine kinase
MTSAAALAPGADKRRSRGPPSLWLLGLVVGVGLLTPVYTAGLAFSDEQISSLHIALLHWISVPYLVVGVVAWWRRPESRLGALMVAGGAAMGLSTLQFASSDLLFTVGAVFDLVPAALFLHLYLAFPDGQLRSDFERVIVSTAYVAAFGLQVVKMTLGEFGTQNVLAISTNLGAAQAVQQIQLVTLSATLVSGIAVLALRRRQEGSPRRRAVSLLVDSFALGLLMIAILCIVGTFESLDFLFQPVQRITLAVIGITPLVFLIGLLDARLARSAVGELMIELRANLPAADLRAALGRALRDPSLILAYWLPDFARYVDLDGRPVVVPAYDGRATTLIERDGLPVAALLHDPALGDERALLDGVTAAAGIALENARLHAELRARLEELQGSRTRVIAAGQRERQRLERNLHDGAQQRLIALSLELSRLDEHLQGDADARLHLDQAREEIALSLGELRDVARGIHPAVLSGHGLEIALESVAAGAPLPVRLQVELESRLDEPLEVAAYYVVCESLVNVGKHARATSATVEVARRNGDVFVEVIDDGVGGADTERGSGLRGLADRVEALGGRLRVWTPAGGGTRVRAEIPCD